MNAQKNQTEQEPQYIDLDDISIATPEGQQEWLHAAMENQYKSTYSPEDEKASAISPWPESFVAKYSMHLMDQIKKQLSQPENSDKDVDVMLREIINKDLKPQNSQLYAESRGLQGKAQISDLEKYDYEVRKNSIEQQIMAAQGLMELLTAERSSRKTSFGELSPEEDAERIQIQIDRKQKAEDAEIQGKANAQYSEYGQTVKGLQNVLAERTSLERQSLETGNDEIEEQKSKIDHFSQLRDILGSALNQRNENGRLIPAESVLKQELSGLEEKHLEYKAKAVAESDIDKKKELQGESIHAFRRAKLIKEVIEKLSK